MPGCQSFKLLCCLFAFVHGAAVIAAENKAQQLASLNLDISSIEILGLQRTEPAVVERELLLDYESFDAQALENSVQRLKNLRIFSDVQTEMSMLESDAKPLKLKLEEKWTTIPIAKFSSGGGTNYFVVGAYDINTFGRYLELGGQYENWNGQNAGVVWFRDPRFLGQRINFGVDLWSVKRPRNLYDESGLELGSYVLDRQKLNFNIDKEFYPWLKLGIGLEFDVDQFAQMDIDQPIDATLRRQLSAAGEGNTRLLRFSTVLGRLDYDNYLVYGKSSELFYETTSSVLDSDFQFTRITWDNKLFWRLPYKANIGTRILVGTTNSDLIQHQFSIGGLENVRGFYDGQFRGSSYWQGNFEFRVPSFRSRWFVLQHNLFFDIAQMKTRFTDLSLNGSDTYYSSGVGVRFTSPKIYRFTMRFDYVFYTSQTGASSIAFGVQQFF